MKLKELLAKINAQKTKVYALVNDGKIEEAKAAKEELKAMQEEYDLLADLGEQNIPDEVPENTSRTVVDEHKDPVHEFAEAVRHKFVNAMSEGTPADGGYTVPEDIQTKINKFKETLFSLDSLTDHETVSTNTGRRTYQTKAQHKGFAAVNEAGKITAAATPRFEVISYTIKKYAGYLPVTNELLADSDANITAVITEWLAREDVATRNNLILAILAEISATAITGLDGIKKAVNVTLGQAYAPTASILTNDDGLNYLDTLKDTTGRYILSPDAQNPMQMSIAVGARRIPIIVAPNATLATDDTTGIPIYVGDFREGVKVFDRQMMSLATSNVASVGTVNAFESDMTIFRGIDRLDVEAKDKAAIAHLTLKNA
ncbi:MAG: phage major capsid protein [Lachnospiraceae bacterium]|nr:phage major capsid protein [Lachnospiraceae bacterium]